LNPFEAKLLLQQTLPEEQQARALRLPGDETAAAAVAATTVAAAVTFR